MFIVEKLYSFVHYVIRPMKVIVCEKVQLNLIKLTLRRFDVKVFLTDRMVGIYFHFDGR